MRRGLHVAVEEADHSSESTYPPYACQGFFNRRDDFIGSENGTVCFLTGDAPSACPVFSLFSLDHHFTSQPLYLSYFLL